MDFLSEAKDWRKFETNSETIALSGLLSLHNSENIRQAYISKYNLEQENIVIFVMITDKKMALACCEKLI